MMRLIQSVFLMALICNLSGCLFQDTGVRARLEKGSTSPVVIPEHMDKPVFVDLMPIPNIENDLAPTDYKIGPPESLITDFSVDKIVIKRLGDQRWVFLDVPPRSVWPHVVRFFEENKLHIETADPASGVIETKLLVSEEGAGETTFQSLKLGVLLTNSKQKHKLRLRIEPGVRSGSTELFLTHRAVIGGYSPEQIDWNQTSDDTELEAVILKELAYNLGDHVTNDQTISLIASGIEDSRTNLVWKREQPVLTYRLDFNRAWATVSAALENAKIQVEDLNRTESYFYIYFNEDYEAETGFFGRLLTRDKDEAKGLNLFQIHLATIGNEVHVSVHSDNTTMANTKIAEKLLKVIKKYSS